ncbi:GGDEF domain-containing protein [Dactylosporangium aurantiacum]|uniref:GGDEF domain-containing protein n=1 Tax=Dactylosporangium aurantiacum TaxID=35754 RepID=A0A9Q9IM09_9ACTN|nr:GGDEF domain-containing protein [Dactylosporangium aurantiacum]MDG6108804.1 GGDEF domain-containing protein [Dactylosporangium aurantiacum]UWZ55789.1 GGDEF domain-containing protein [Dactylosporangium aurantiacum]
MFITILVIATIAAAILSIGFGLGRLAARPALNRVYRELADAAWQLAHDPLTGLFNRTGLHAVYSGFAAPEPQPLIVMLLDLDGFKAVNDTYGHDGGDTLLMEVADRISSISEINGGAAARLSGDEFVILLPVGDQQIASLADAFVSAVGRPVQVDTNSGPVATAVTASIGVAVIESTDHLEDVALHRADTAMYHAKHQGGNRHIIYAPGMTMPDRQHRRGARPRDVRHNRPGVTA